MQHVFEKNDRAFHTARLCAENVVAPELFEHLSAKLPQKARAHRYCQSKAGEDKPLYAFVCKDRQKVGLDAEKVHKQHRNEKIGQRISDEAQKLYDVIENAVLLNGTYNGQRKRYYERNRKACHA